jgi:AraC-like DNA-binding protein
VEQETFGLRLAQRMDADPTLPIITRGRRADIEVIRMRRAAMKAERSEALPAQDAVLLGVQLADCTDREVWLEDRPLAVKPLSAGSFVAYDLRRQPAWRTNGAFDAVLLHIPRDALTSLTEAAGLPPPGDLTCAQGIGHDDPIIRDLTSLLLPALEAPGMASPLFLDNVIIALCAHISQTYGDRPPRPILYRGGLAAWQERRAKEMLNASLAGTIRIAELAGECGLSTSQFSRSFRQSTGLAPHQWLMKRRVDVAKDLLGDRNMALSDISLACGFADQSHFTRIFSREIGVSPGAWRRGSPGERAACHAVSAC